MEGKAEDLLYKDEDNLRGEAEEEEGEEHEINGGKIYRTLRYSTFYCLGMFAQYSP